MQGVRTIGPISTKVGTVHPVSEVRFEISVNTLICPCIYFPMNQGASTYVDSFVQACLLLGAISHVSNMTHGPLVIPYIHVYNAISSYL